MSSLFYVIDTVILIGQYSSFFAAHGNLFNASIFFTAKIRDVSQKISQHPLFLCFFDKFFSLDMR